MIFIKEHKNKIFLFVFVVFLILFFVFSPKIFSEHYSVKNFISNNVVPEETKEAEKIFVPSYVSTPVPVKGIYMTSWVAGTPSLRSKLVKIADDTEINTVVIDIKDYSGKIVFPVDNPEFKAFGSEEIRVSDMRDFIESLHKKGIYVVGRIAVFQDAYFVKHRPDLAVKNKAGTAVWKDRKGISWIDPGSREYWGYIKLVVIESRKIGFDEINFDYIRFPSDGDMTDISYPWSSTTPKAEVLKDFFAYLHDEFVVNHPLGEGDKRMKISADLFGMVTTAKDDMGIGQLLENALPYFDYIMPMVYPSHYPPTFQGYKNPEAYPYEVVKYAMGEAVKRSELLASTTGQTVADLRPWLQDFGLKMTYGSSEVRAQIKATNDVGLDSWVLWSPSNKYTTNALIKE